MIIYAMNAMARSYHASYNGQFGKASPNLYGHVKLTDNYASPNGSASDGVAASSLAVANLYKYVNNLSFGGGGDIGEIVTKDNIDETLNDKITIVPSSFIDGLFK